MKLFITVMTLMVLFAIILFAIPLWRKQQRLKASLLSLLFIAVSITAYLQWGSSQQLPQWFVAQQRQAEVKQVLEELKTPEKVIEKMEKHLASKPDSAEGWYLLGRLYASVNRKEDAKAAFVRAKALLDAQEPEKNVATVKVHIDLANQFKKQQLDPNTTLFIFAKAVNGPPMPLAVIRKQLKDLPLDITLSDENAMAPQAKLSQFPEFYITARLAKANTPQAKIGDLQGKSSILKLADAINTPVNIEISEVVQ